MLKFFVGIAETEVDLGKPPAINSVVMEPAELTGESTIVIVSNRLIPQICCHEIDELYAADDCCARLCRFCKDTIPAGR